MTREVPLREMIDEETYKKYEPRWSNLRMQAGWEPLPKSYEKFREKMGWDNEQ